MLGLEPDRTEAVASPARDTVEGVESDRPPRIVSVSDVHGYLGAARSALRAVGEHPDLAPLVRVDDESRLHWAGGTDYVLVFNGDLIDRGPDNEGVLELVERLTVEAPPGHVRTTLGNHEWAVLFPSHVRWAEWFSGQVSDAERREFCRAIAHGHVVAAYRGHNFTYAHAGRRDPYDAARLNDRLAEAASRLSDAVATDADERRQRTLVEEYQDVLGLGRQSGRGRGAGVTWLDFRFLEPDSPPQIVGHTRQEQPIQRGNVVCENVIRANQKNAGGEAVLVESPDRLRSLERTFDGRVHAHEFDVPTVD